MGGCRIALVTLAALIAAGASGGAVAQPKDPGGDIEMGPAAPVKDPKAARKWLAAGQQLMQKGSYFVARNRPDEAKPQFENAVTAFLRAIEAGDDVNVYFELAGAEDWLGKPDDAVKHLRLVINAKAGVRPDVARKATAKLDELLAKVGLVTLSVAPDGTSITLGGIELGTSPLPEPLVLMPGTYTLSFQAVGFQPKEAELSVEAGSEIERVIELDPVKVIVEPVRQVVPEEVVPEDRPQPAPLALYLGAGITGVAVAGAGVCGILALREHGRLTRASSSAADREDAQTRGKLFALITDASLATAVVAGGLTAYWYFYKYKQQPGNPNKRPQERRSPPVETKLDVVPWVQPQSGGVTIAGWF
jgi:lysozyme family protein